MLVPDEFSLPSTATPITLPVACKTASALAMPFAARPWLTRAPTAGRVGADVAAEAGAVVTTGCGPVNTSDPPDTEPDSDRDPDPYGDSPDADADADAKPSPAEAPVSPMLPAVSIAVYQLEVAGDPDDDDPERMWAVGRVVFVDGVVVEVVMAGDGGGGTVPPTLPPLLLLLLLT